MSDPTSAAPPYHLSLSKLGNALRVRAAEAVARLQVPGAAIAMTAGEEEWLETFGVTSLEHPLPVDGDTIFRVSSITKSFVAVTALRLVERGLLDLHQPIRAYLPTLRLADERVAQTITMAHLLRHEAGWADLPNGAPDAPLSSITDIVANLPQLRPPGVWSYCNSGMMLAGRVVEVASGRPFRFAMKEFVFDPLGMKRSFLELGDMITHRLAVGHTRPGMNPSGDGEPVAARPTVVRPWDDPPWTRPSIGLGTSARDLLCYVGLQLRGGVGTDGTRFLEKKHLDLMHTPSTADGQVGLVWFTQRAGGCNIVSLGGAGLGFGVYVVMVPARRFGIVVLTNAAGHAFDREITHWVLCELGVEHEIRVLPMSTSQLSAYAGNYISEHQLVEIEPRECGLRMIVHRTSEGAGGAAGRPPAVDELPLIFYEEDRVVVTEGARRSIRGEFLRDSDGRVSMLRFPTLVHIRER